MMIRNQSVLATVVAMGHLVVLAMSATTRDTPKSSDPFLDVKRPADQDTYDAYVSGKKSLVTSFQVTPVIATNTECVKKGKHCEWREVGIHERASGFVMLRNNANFKDPSHNFAFSCVICGTDALCSDPDDHAMRATINKNMKDGTVGHHLRLDKVVKKVTAKCKNSMPERKLSMKHLRTIHQGLSSLMGMPESVGAGMEGANVGASDLLDDPNFGSPDGGLAVVQGTKYLSPSRINSLKTGKDVNDGDVKNSEPYVKASLLREKLVVVPTTSGGNVGKTITPNTGKKTQSTPISVNSTNSTFALLDLGSTIRRRLLASVTDSKISPTELEDFKTSAGFLVGMCGDDVEALALFKNVFMEKNGSFKFSCLDNKELCKCISKVGRSKDTVTLTDSKFELSLKGNGEFCSYSLVEKKGRRRLLQKIRGGC